MARPRIKLQPDEAEELRHRARASTVSVRDRRRSEIVLLSAEGLTQQQIAERLDISRLQVNCCVERFVTDRLAGLGDAPGHGREPWLAEGAAQQVLERAVTPPPHLGRWSCRTMARAVGISAASVQRLWAANDIRPHLLRTFKLSNDKRFEEKFWDVIGLYLDPPEKALVLCCDEKSQCQALERTQPSLPLGIGHIRTKTHDYVRHGTLTLFAVLNYLDGKLITRLAARHRYQEWLAFLKLIDRQSPPDLDLHVIADNYATHKHPQVTMWLQQHPRFHMHYTPTSSSWMNLVERFFGDLTPFISEKSFASTRELADAIITSRKTGDAPSLARRRTDDQPPRPAHPAPCRRACGGVCPACCICRRQTRQGRHRCVLDRRRRRGCDPRQERRADGDRRGQRQGRRRWLHDRGDGARRRHRHSRPVRSRAGGG
jgi:transposase